MYVSPLQVVWFTIEVDEPELECGDPSTKEASVVAAKANVGRIVTGNIRIKGILPDSKVQDAAKAALKVYLKHFELCSVFLEDRHAPWGSHLSNRSTGSLSSHGITRSFPSMDENRSYIL